MSFVTHSEIPDLIEALAPLASKCDVEDAYWIATPNGDHEFENGNDCCADCGATGLTRLKAEDPEDAADYLLDGGWVSEHDTPPSCAVCGVKLHASLTTAGGIYELNHFMANAPTPGNAGYPISEVDLIIPSAMDQHNFTHLRNPP